jgi:hypothetical protein
MHGGGLWHEGMTPYWEGLTAALLRGGVPPYFGSGNGSASSARSTEGWGHGLPRHPVDQWTV